MIHNVLAIVFVLVTASFYDGIARELSEEASFELIGDSDDEEIDKNVHLDYLRVFSLYAITGCRPEDYSYECVEKRKWDNVLERPDKLFDYFYAKDKNKLTHYLSSVIREKIQYRQFTRWEQSVKHKELRRLIAVKLVGFLELLSNKYLVSIYEGQVKESLLKYAVRFVFYGKNKKCIDNVDVVKGVYHKLLFPSGKGYALDLAFIKDKNFQSLLMYAHELFQVFFKKKIQVLALYKCDLVAVPDFNMPHLRELWLFKNNIKKVPNFRLPNLQVLDLVFNDLTSVPNFTLNGLKQLKLSYNRLKTIPNFDLQSLEVLTLAHNKLVQLPALSLPNLTHLDIFGNQWLEIANNQTDKLLYDCPKLNKIVY